jgi:glycosyltransferase involved in cell wall biosynthesis
MNSGPRILDIVNTDHAALNFLAHRVGWINRNTDFQNDIVCSNGPHLDKFEVPGAQIKALDIPRGLSPFGVTKLLAQLTAFLRRNKYTIVHTHNSITGVVGRIAARMAGVPVVIHTTHGFHFHEAMSALERLPYVGIERAMARWCDMLLCQNRQEIDEIHRLRLHPRQGVYHVGNGIDLSDFKARTAPPQNARPVILFVGRLEAVKNQTMLFRALEQLRGRHEPELWLVGDGPRKAAYEQELAERGLSANVKFLGYRYDIPALTAQADIAVLTSVKEGIPRALMQASAVGVPIIATDVKGTREVVVDGETGFLVRLDDVATLTERLDTLLGSAELRRDMGVRGVEHARRHFDEVRVVERLARLYRIALRARGLAEMATPAVTEMFQTERQSA